jgi:predicted nucleic acid-binding protein
MPEGRVICNTSPLYYLHLVGQLDLLPRLYSQVRIPPAVREELHAGEKKGVPTPRLEALPWLEIQESVNRPLLPMVIDLGRPRPSHWRWKIPEAC